MAQAHSLCSIDLFESFDPEALAGVERKCSWSKHAVGTVIANFLDEDDSVCFVTEGCAHVVVYSVGGRAVEFRELRSGDWLCEYEVLGQLGQPARVEAAQDCVVAKLPGAKFRELVETNPVLSGVFIQHLKEQLGRLTARVYEFSTLAVKERVHAELLRLVRDQAAAENVATIENPPTHLQIASRISTHREAVARELNQLARNGLIERAGNSLIVRDVSCLERMVAVANAE
ncbi:MAG: Crp/Fnr family transcriptional regulator [Pseudomonadota bacterium]